MIVQIVDQIVTLCQEVKYEVLCTHLSDREKTFIELVINTCRCGFFLGPLTRLTLFYFLLIFLISTQCYHFIHGLIMFFPLFILSLLMIIQFVDCIMLLLASALKFDPLNPLVVQVVNKKLCITVSTSIIWFLLFLCTHREYYKIRKEFKWTHVISCVITFSLTTVTVLYNIICKIRFIICHFFAYLPIASSMAFLFLSLPYTYTQLSYFHLLYSS